MQNHDPSRSLTALVDTPDEFDRLMGESLPDLLDRASAQTRRFLRETGQWGDDIEHEKLALRWGYELIERFLSYGRSELPCRPLFLLDSFIAKCLSQPKPFFYHPDLCSPLGRFLDGLTARAVISRDALMAVFYHLYGFSPVQVVRLLGLGAEDSHRIYKNFERWRRNGWQRTMSAIGLDDGELDELEREIARRPIAVNKEADGLNRLIQAHYRRSEPEHFLCKSTQEWEQLFSEDYGYDYRTWHLALCTECLLSLHGFRQLASTPAESLQVHLRLRPWQGRGLSLIVSQGGSRNGVARQSGQRLSTTSH